MQLFNAATQKDEDVVCTVDANNEVVATFEDGSFRKFPAGMTEDEIAEHAADIKAASIGQEVITPEMQAAQEEQTAASQELVDQLNNGNTMPEGNKTNEPPSQPAAPAAPTAS